MDENQARKRRRLIGVGFVLAFALSTATIIYTGLNVRAPGSTREAETTASEPVLPAAAEEESAQGAEQADEPAEAERPSAQ